MNFPAVSVECAYIERDTGILPVMRRANRKGEADARSSASENVILVPMLFDLLNDFCRRPRVAPPDFVDFAVLVYQCGGKPMRNRAAFGLHINGKSVRERVNIRRSLKSLLAGAVCGDCIADAFAPRKRNSTICRSFLITREETPSREARGRE